MSTTISVIPGSNTGFSTSKGSVNFRSIIDAYYASLAQRSKIIAAEDQHQHNLVSPPHLSLSWDAAERRPVYILLIDGDFVRNLNSEQAVLNGTCTPTSLLNAASESTSYAVSPNFSTSAINEINALYYSCSFAFDADSQLASYFVESEPINIAFANFINQSFHDSEIRIKEICGGQRQRAWQTIGRNLSGKTVQLTYTDFNTPSLNGAEVTGLLGKNIVIEPGRYSLFEPMEIIPKPDRYHMMITTYGFDSVDLPEDITYQRIGGRFYRKLYRVKVSDAHVNKDKMLQALKTGTPFCGINLDDFLNGVFVEECNAIADLSKVPSGREIEKRFDKIDHKRNHEINFPGGLIKRVVNAFDNQLKREGVFVIADVAVGDDLPYQEDVLTSGYVARYRSKDFVLAKQILEEKYDFKVDLYHESDFLDKYNSVWEGQFIDEEERKFAKNKNLNNHYIMIVRRKNRFNPSQNV